MGGLGQKTHTAELVAIESLQPHPQNYRQHPPDQIRHLVQSIVEHGVYRNVIVADDGTILAGHGVVQAAIEAGLEQLPVVRLPLAPNDPKALKLLTADNEIGRLAEIDDRALSELLKEIATDDDLFGTGFDEQMLANLIYVTRGRDEIQSHDQAGEWLGLPEFTSMDTDKIRLVIDFDSEEDRERFVAEKEVPVHRQGRGALRTWTAHWPEKRERHDLNSVVFD